MRSASFVPHMNHVSVSPTNGNGPTQGQRKTLTRVGIDCRNIKIGIDCEQSLFDWRPFRLTNDGNRPEWSPFRSVIIRVINKIGRQRNESPIFLITSRIELDDTKSFYQLIIKITISEETKCIPISQSNVKN